MTKRPAIPTVRDGISASVPWTLVRRLTANAPGQRRINIVSEFSSATGGTELRAINLYRLLSPHIDTRLWSIDTPPSGLSHLPIQKIDTSRLRGPRWGTLVLVGCYFHLGQWLNISFPKRVIMTYNTPDPERFTANIERVRTATGVEPEVRYASSTLQATVGFPGKVEQSLIDLDPLLSIVRSSDRPFTVGRLSRSEEIKFHDDDPALFRELAKRGFVVRIMGASGSVYTRLSGLENVEIIGAGKESLVEFLTSIDVFVYRTNARWDEPWGRVIVEAMAAGLPVVCEPRGGYKEIVQDQVTGVFFTRNEEAVSVLTALRADPAAASALGAEGRRVATAILSEGVRAEILASYLNAA